MTIDLSKLIISIFLGFIGLLIGNFMTTAIYRIPKGLTIAGFDQQTTQPPFCGICHHLLKFYEYLPLLSWITTRGKCNYCGATINKLYIVIEISGLIGAIVLYWLIGLSEIYVLLLLNFAMTLLAIGLFVEEKKIYWSVVFAMVGLGVVYNALVYHTTLDCVMRIVMIIIGCISLSNLIKLRLITFLPDYSPKNTLAILIPVASWCDFWLVVSYIGLVIVLYCCTVILRNNTRHPRKEQVMNYYCYLVLIGFLVIVLKVSIL